MATNEKRWQSFLLRMRTVAHENSYWGATQLSVTLYLNKGALDFWTDPSITHLEPRANPARILRRLGATLDVDDAEPEGKEGIERLEEGA